MTSSTEYKATLSSPATPTSSSRRTFQAPADLVYQA